MCYKQLEITKKVSYLSKTYILIEISTEIQNENVNKNMVKFIHMVKYSEK